MRQKVSKLQVKLNSDIQEAATGCKWLSPVEATLWSAIAVPSLSRFFITLLSSYKKDSIRVTLFQFGRYNTEAAILHRQGIWIHSMQAVFSRKSFPRVRLAAGIKLALTDRRSGVFRR